MAKLFKTLVTMAAVASLSACVTQNYEEDDTPVIQNESTDNEIALTRISLGLGYLKMGNTTQAKFNLEKARRYAPDLVEVYTAFAHYYESVGEDELTIASYNKALSLKSDDADTLNNYGVYLCRKERLDEAEVQFLRAINVPTYLRVSESYENLALCQLEAFKFEKAEHYLDKAISHSPSNDSALYQMMRLQYAIGEYKTAQVYGKRFEKSSRRFTAEYMALAHKTYNKMGNTRLAANYGTMLVKMYPKSWYAKQYLLNGLESIDADDLATQYQILSDKKQSHSVNKRVVVLSPNRKAPISFSKKRREAPNRTHNTRVVAQPANSVSLEHPTSQDARSYKQQAPTNVKAKRTLVLKAPKLEAPQESTLEKNYTRQTNNVDDSAAVASVSSADGEVVEATDALIAEISKNASAYDDSELVENSSFSGGDELLDDSYNDESIDAVLAEAEALIQSDETLAALAKEYDEQLASEQATEDELANAFTDNQQIETHVNADELLDEKFANLVTEPEVGNLSRLSQSEQLTNVPVYNTVADIPTHTMAEGENLFKVSRDYNIHLHALRKWNELDDNTLLKVGDVIYLADPNLVAQGNK